MKMLPSLQGAAARIWSCSGEVVKTARTNVLKLPHKPSLCPLLSQKGTSWVCVDLRYREAIKIETHPCTDKIVTPFQARTLIIVSMRVPRKCIADWQVDIIERAICIAIAITLLIMSTSRLDKVASAGTWLRKLEIWMLLLNLNGRFEES